jgi:hypothetical protein
VYDPIENMYPFVFTAIKDGYNVSIVYELLKMFATVRDILSLFCNH